MDANLLVSYNPNHPIRCKEEVENILKVLKIKPRFLKSTEGIFHIRVPDPRKTVKKLRRVCAKNPNLFFRTSKWTPVDRWTSSTVKGMQKAIKKLDRSIKPSESWRLDLNKRRDKKSWNSLILKLTDPIDKPKVDMKDPKKILKVDILGKKAALSLLKPAEIFNALKVKREL